jgi:excisionase family DNA binding protein
VRIVIELNGVPVPVDLDDGALRAIAAALPTTDPDPAWPALMSVQTASRYLDSSPERIRKLAARGQIPYVQEAKGCRLEFSRDDLDQWIRIRRAEANAETSSK